MEDKEGIAQIHWQKLTEIGSVLGEEEAMAETEERKDESLGMKIASDKKEVVSEKTESKSNASKKPNQISQHTQKAKTTVPRPFSLATEKRMARQRHGSMDLSSECAEETADKLSKSASFSHKTQPSQVAREASNLKRAATSSRPTAQSKEQMTKKIASAVKIKDKTKVECQNLPPNSKKKQQAKELEKRELDKSFTFNFKASPLPSFYRRKDPPSKPETKKISATRPKSPVLGRHRNKSSANTENGKTENKGKNSSSTGISDRTKETSASNEKTKTEHKGKSNASAGISVTAKETLNRFIKGTKKALNTSKETMKLVVSKA